jgi:hypothetical protein
MVVRLQTVAAVSRILLFSTRLIIMLCLCLLFYLKLTDLVRCKAFCAYDL